MWQVDRAGSRPHLEATLQTQAASAVCVIVSAFMSSGTLILTFNGSNMP